MRLLSVLFIFLLGSAMAAESPRTLSWSDLMPSGEESALAQQQDSYIAEIEEQLQSQESQSLFDAGEAENSSGVPEGSALDTMPQLGTFNVVKELDGERVRIPGFVLPFEFSASGKIKEFLLVPYFGACIHFPPPPPNQLVYVTAEKAMSLGDQWEPIWATGVLRAKSKMNDLGDAAYTLEIESWETYDG